MTSNYNEIHIYGKNHEYKEGDVFKVSETQRDWKIWRFNGLFIETVRYNYGTILHFNHDEWFDNIENGYLENIDKQIKDNVNKFKLVKQIY